MDWNPLTWTFATTFFGVSLLKWGIVVGGIVFLALLRKLIIGTRTVNEVHSHPHTTTAAATTVTETITTPALSNEAIELVAAAAVKETPAVKQKMAKVKAFKGAVVMAKKKRKAKAKKATPVKTVETVPPAIEPQPIVDVKTEAIVVQPKAIPAIAKAKQKAKPKKKIIKAKPVAAPKAEKAKPVAVENVTKTEAVQPRAEPPMMIATASNVSASPKQATPKTKAMKAIAKPKTVPASIAKESKQQKAETKTAEEKISTPATKPVRTRNPGFI
ncbi:MAG: hypothetical protein IPJ89_01645 [Candidatus Iainarchaeum archaeon]|uniref:Uncharacterized protein n=1 Tax=Candidatus Iainarchaeum sp. TaxID=3101447 RepID=A0A7T9I2D4_9ARCH|nr:MAG: hypothetical protein IPJ89_01645 [Candidatus Diapherotrites archaeon]